MSNGKIKKALNYIGKNNILSGIVTAILIAIGGWVWKLVGPISFGSAYESFVGAKVPLWLFLLIVTVIVILLFWVFGRKGQFSSKSSRLIFDKVIMGPISQGRCQICGR
jgi:hypothetical protein